MKNTLGSAPAGRGSLPAVGHRRRGEARAHPRSPPAPRRPTVVRPRYPPRPSPRYNRSRKVAHRPSKEATEIDSGAVLALSQPAAGGRGGGEGFLVVNNFSAFIFHLYALLNRLLIPPLLPDAGLETSEKSSEKLYFCRRVQRGVLPSAFCFGGFCPKHPTTSCGSPQCPREMTRTSFHVQTAHPAAPLPARAGGSGRLPSGNPKPCPEPTSPPRHAHPRPGHPRHRPRLSPTGAGFITPRPGATPQLSSTGAGLEA